MRGEREHARARLRHVERARQLDHAPHVAGAIGQDERAVIGGHVALLGAQLGDDFAQLGGGAVLDAHQARHELLAERRRGRLVVDQQRDLARAAGVDHLERVAAALDGEAERLERGVEQAIDLAGGEQVGHLELHLAAARGRRRADQDRLTRDLAERGHQLVHADFAAHVPAEALALGVAPAAEELGLAGRRRALDQRRRGRGVRRRTGDQRQYREPAHARRESNRRAARGGARLRARRARLSASDGAARTARQKCV
jgi:hypothetical protein